MSDFSIAGFKGPTSKERRGEGRGKEGGRGGKVRKGKRGRGTGDGDGRSHRV